MAKSKRKSPFVFRIEGDKELDRNLNKLVFTVQKKVLRKAAREAMKVVARRAKQEIPRASGRTARSITVRAGKRSRKYPFKLMVLFKNREELLKKSKGYPDGFFYPAAVEYGVKAISRPAQAPMRRTYKATRTEATAIAHEQIAKGVEAEAARIGKS